MPGAGGRPTQGDAHLWDDDRRTCWPWATGWTQGGVTHVAMESTGVYWKPLWNLFEDRFTLLLVNAAHVKVVPGRKRDVGDAEWLADLLQHGLLRASFVPGPAGAGVARTDPLPQQPGAGAHGRGQPAAEDAGRGQHQAGQRGQRCHRGLGARDAGANWWPGTEDAAALAELAEGQLRRKLPELEQALTGRMSAHQRFMLAQHLTHIDALDAQIDRGQRRDRGAAAPF